MEVVDPSSAPQNDVTQELVYKENHKENLLLLLKENQGEEKSKMHPVVAVVVIETY